MSDKSIFSKIIDKEIPSYTIAEDDFFYAFLDIYPLVLGHTLVVPKLEIDKIYTLPDNYLSRLWLFAKPIALSIERAFPCARCGFSVIGLEVSHAHLHLVPINSASDLNFTRPKLNVSKEDMLYAQKEILKFL